MRGRSRGTVAHETAGAAEYRVLEAFRQHQLGTGVHEGAVATHALCRAHQLSLFESRRRDGVVARREAEQRGCRDGAAGVFGRRAEEGPAIHLGHVRTPLRFAAPRAMVAWYAHWQSRRTPTIMTRWRRTVSVAPAFYCS